MSKYCHQLYRLVLFCLVLLFSNTSYPLSCSTGNTDTTNGSFLTLGNVYAYSLPFTGGSWKINSVAIRVNQATAPTGANANIVVAVVKINMSDGSVASYYTCSNIQSGCSDTSIAQCTTHGVNGTSGTYSTVTCTFASPVIVNLGKSSLYKVGIQVNTDTASILPYSTNSLYGVVTAVEAYSTNMTSLATTASTKVPEISINYEPLGLAAPNSSTPHLLTTNVATTAVAQTRGGSNLSTAAIACHSGFSNADQVYFDHTDRAMKRYGNTFIPNTTIATGTDTTATYNEQKRLIWQNPRSTSKKYYYAALYKTGSGPHIYYGDGTTWTEYVTLGATTAEKVAMYGYDDGNQYILYVFHLGTWVSNSSVGYFRRFLIQDSDTAPSTDSGDKQFDLNGGNKGIGNFPFIFRDRNGYLHVFVMGSTSFRDHQYLWGSSTVDSGTTGWNPTWENQTVMRSHAGSSVLDDSGTLFSFNSTNLFGAIFMSKAGGTNPIWSQTIQSYTHAGGYSLVTGPETIIAGTSASHPFSVAVDTSDITHIAYEATGLYYKSAKAAGIVTDTTNGAFNSPITIDSSTPTTVALSIDKTVSPNRIYVFYHVGTDSYLRWRYMDVGGSAFSAVSFFKDSGSHNIDYFQSAINLAFGAIPIIYTDQTNYGVNFTLFSP